MLRYKELKEQFPDFIYDSYSYEVKDQGVDGYFQYRILNSAGSAAYTFQTTFSIHHSTYESAVDGDLDTLVYTLGMMEAISYWKLTCSDRFTIKCGSIDSWQESWWQKLYANGLSEFFFVNEIANWDGKSLQFISESNPLPIPNSKRYDETIIVPIGGGKDSITTVETLSAHKEIIPIVMNPIEASSAYINYKGYSSHIKIGRKLDSQIVELNAQGFLNGHIPFSAVLSLYTMVAARLYGHQHIALSNESSANEPTILGTNINHQYSKSLEYEEDINQYVSKYLDPNINYFSFLRPLNEYQITKLFSGFDDSILKLFRSCNVGSKKGVWCCKCPKCLFTYIMLHAHLSSEKMGEIFGQDLLDDPELKGYFLSLTGQRNEKPFECVGTIEEVNAALAEIKKKRKSNLPSLLQYWNEELVEKSGEALLDEFHPHRLRAPLEEILKNTISSINVY